MTKVMRVKHSNSKTKKNRSTKHPLTKYVAKDFSYLLGKVKGIDDKLMKIHFTLYEGLVGATNKTLETIHSSSLHGVKNMPEYSAIKKEFPLFFNGMRLHEQYFGQMCGENMDKVDADLSDAIKKTFGSFDNWKKHFIETGTIPGVGFASLCRDRLTGRLMNVWINEFQIGELINVDILLVVDMWEHAYIAEFGLDLPKYIDVYLANVNWSFVSEKWQESLRNSHI